MPQFSIHFGTYFAGGSGNSSFPSLNLRLISHELAADKNSPSRSFDRRSRALRFNLPGTARAQRNTPVSSRYFIASHASDSFPDPGKRPARPAGVVRQSRLRPSSAPSQSPTPGVSLRVGQGPSAPREPHDLRSRSPHLR